MEQYLKTFKQLIQPLGTQNVVIGGTIALKAHGLIMSREATDLDLIIFNPTEKQKAYIESMKFFEIENRNIPQHVYQKSFKFKKANLTIDILIQESEVPQGLLYAEFEGTFYKVQSIKNTIDAKRSYCLYGSIGGNVKYIREKDVKDFEDLKSSNFNL